MKFPTIKEMAEEVAEKSLDEFEYKGKTLRQWIEIISATELGTNLAEVGTDCISREQAINALSTITMSMYKGSIPFNTAVMRIEQLPSAQPEQRWIPWSSGKLPEESGTYTVTAYDGVTKRVTYAKYQKRLKRWELTGARAYWRVLAWMPLPEPYKEVTI